jgi:uncharacterized protein (TIGR00661 family)
MVLPREIEQRVHTGSGHGKDRSAVTPVAAVGPAFGFEFLAAETDAPVAAVATPDVDFRAIDKHGRILAKGGTVARRIATGANASYKYARMARIVYGVSGDGYGHAVRAHSVGAGLLERGHEILFVGSHKSVGYLGRHFPQRVHESLGLRMTYREGRVAVLDTVLRNAVRLAGSLTASNRRLSRTLTAFRPEFVITDFEPFTALWARQSGVPYVSLDNQHLITHCDFDHPRRFRRDLWSAYLTIRMYYGGAKRYLISTFVNAPIRYQPATIINPVLRPRVYRITPSEGDYLLAYKGAGGDNRTMRDELAAYGRMPVRAYGFDEVGRCGSTTFQPFCSGTFLEDLAGCAGVIATAGHSLVCEALFFEKPMLLVPIAAQYEQLLNAYHVERIGAGMTVAALTRSALDEFVDRMPQFRRTLKGTPKADLNPVLDAVEREMK